MGMPTGTDALDELAPLLTGVRIDNMDLSGVRVTPLTPYLREKTGEGPLFLFARDGAARITLMQPGAQPVLIRRGSFAALPHGHGFRLVPDKDHPAAALLIGTATLDRRAVAPLLHRLPPLLFMCPSRTLGMDWQDGTFAMVEAALAQGDLAGRLVAQRLLESLFIIAVRRFLETNETYALGASRTATSVGRALVLMQDRLADDWTLASLADASGLSQATLIRRFQALVGEAPMAHLTRLRMERAAKWLKSGDDKLAVLASRLGYQSEAAFARRFKEFHGVWPGEFRRVG